MEIDPQKIGEHSATLISALGLGKLIEYFTNRDTLREMQKQIDRKLNESEFKLCKENEVNTQAKMETWMRDIEAKADKTLEATNRIEGYLKGLADKA